jgi:hypothetical protein
VRGKVPRQMLCTVSVSLARTASRQPARRSESGRRPRLSLIALLACLLACPVTPGGGEGSLQTNYPPASVYEVDPLFTGEWSGDVDGLPGTLTIGELDERSFFGSFVTSDRSTEYTLLLEHTYVETPEGGEAPSNRTIFTWQDGLGSRGKGWLLINREDTALTGSFGYGTATEGLGQWSFVRAQ